MPDDPNHWYEGTQINEEGLRVPVDADAKPAKKAKAKAKDDDEK